MFSERYSRHFSIYPMLLNIISFDKVYALEEGFVFFGNRSMLPGASKVQ